MAQLPEFMSSGLCQLGRVARGPRPRRTVPAQQGYATVRQVARIEPTKLLPRGSNSQVVDSTFVLLTLAAPAPLLFAEDVELLSDTVRLLSDTVRHVFAGTVARTMAQMTIHPLDTIKTRLQRWRKVSKAQPIDVFLGNHRVLHMRNWLVQGPRDIYRGILGAVVGTVPTAFLYFSVYEWSKGQLEERGLQKSLTHLVSASAGAIVSAFVRVPTDTLKHRVQAYYLPNIFNGARSIIAAEGVGGLYHGLLPTLLRDVPEIAIQFALYERLRCLVERHRQQTKLRTWEHLVLGGLCGGCAASVTMPLDVAKTALQCGSGRSITEVFGQVLADKGARGLFAGMAPRVTQTAIMSAVFFALFEAAKAQLKPHRLPEDSVLRRKLWQKRRDHVWKRQFTYQA